MAQEANKRRKIDSTSGYGDVASMSDVLKLNVGGQAYVTLRSTLCDDVNSMLFSKFNPDSAFASPAEVEGMIFIDRDPNCFKYVLNFLRCGCRARFDPRDVDLKQLAAEADYFGLVTLKEFCEKEQKVRDERNRTVLGQRDRMDVSIVKIAEEAEKQSARTADLVTRSISRLGGNIDRVGSAIQNQTKAMKHEAKKISSAVEEIAQNTENQSGSLEGIANSLEELSDNTADVKDAIDNAGKDIKESIGDVGTALVGFGYGVGGDSLLEASRDQSNDLNDAIDRLSDSVTAKIEDCLDKAGDIVNASEGMRGVMEDLGSKVEDVTSGIEDVGDKVGGVTSSIEAGVGDTFSGTVAEKVEDLASNVKDLQTAVEELPFWFHMPLDVYLQGRGLAMPMYGNVLVQPPPPPPP